MKNLWAPWRMSYLQSNRESSSGAFDSCIFCDALRHTDDRASLIVHRGKACFVILNLYPYNNGHLMVVPHAHVSTIEDVPDLSMENADRVRRWDSCFTDDFSYIHGGNMRPSVSSRYRHWITHKLSTWYDQFGTSGCVGCGRCITWCPPGIDITEEVRAIRASEEASQ